MKVHAVAPGKVVLLGEYAVLEGHRALCAAVDRYAYVTGSPQKPARLLSKNLGISWEGGEAPPELRAALSLFQALGARGSWEIDTSPLFAAAAVGQGEMPPPKLGLGSSGAALAALCVALAPERSPLERFQLVQSAHRAAQGGVGSGVDVAASTFGGLLVHQIHKNPGPKLSFGRCGVALLFLASGVAASTVDLVAKVRAAKDREAVARALAQISAAAEEAIFALEEESAGRLLKSFQDGSEAARALAEAAQAPLWLPVHSRADQIARAFGGSAKPTGAGGGDIILIAAPEEAVAPLTRKLQEENLPPLPLQIDPFGARLLDAPPGEVPLLSGRSPVIL